MFLSRALVILDLQTRNDAWIYVCIKIIIFNMQNQKDNLCSKLEMTNFYMFPLLPMFQDYCTAAPMKSSLLIPNIAEGKCCTRFLSLFFSLDFLLKYLFLSSAIKQLNNMNLCKNISLMVLFVSFIIALRRTHLQCWIVLKTLPCMKIISNTFSLLVDRPLKSYSWK